MEPLSLARSAARALLRRPGHTLLVVATFALGIGGSTAIFALVDGVLLESVPFEEPERLVTLDPTYVPTGFGISLSIPHYRDWRDRNQVFQEFGGSAGWSFVRQTPEGAEQLRGRMVLGAFFPLLGLEPAVGRLFTGPETEAGAEAVVVLGHGFWQRAWGGDPAAVGSTLLLDGDPFTVVGVLAAGQGYPDPGVDVYVPMGVRASTLPWDDRGSSFGTRALARLAPGVTLQAAQRDMDRVTGEVFAETGTDHVTAGVRTVEDLFLGDVRRGLWLLMGSVLLILVIGGANVANLALARGERRRGEMAVRWALGAGRNGLLGLVAAESLCLALLGGAVGVGSAALLLEVLPTVLPLDIPALVAGRVGMDRETLLFATGLTLATGILFALVPAVRALHRPEAGLHEGRGALGGPGSPRFRTALVAGQVALSVVLLVGAGLLLRSLGGLTAVEKGFDERDVLTARVSPPRGTFTGAEPWLAFHRALLERLRASPDVEAAATTLLLPLSGSSWELRVRSEAGPVDPQEQPSVLFNLVSEGYFETLGVPILRGRGFTARDTEDAPPVAVVDQRLAERFWPGEDPLGRQVSWEEDHGGEPVWRTVVGVAANTRHYELESPSRIQAYQPMAQPGLRSGVGLRIAAKVQGDAAAVGALLRATVAELQPSIPVSEVRMLEELVADELADERSLGLLTAAFGITAVLLTCLGLFGVLSLVVARRSGEIGLRMAVGASPRAVVGMVVGQGLATVLTGVAVGLLAAGAAAGVLESVLYDVDPRDPRIYLAVAAGLTLVALLAVVTPALRAASVPPGRVLREE